MQVTQTNAEGLKREFKVVVPAADIEQHIDDRLKEVGKDINMPGFRPGKVPTKILRQKYGNQVVGEVLDKVMRESMEQTLSDHDLRPAAQPDVQITSFDEGQDLHYDMSVEVMPEVPALDYSQISLERPRADVTDGEVDELLDHLARVRKTTEPVEEERPAEEGDTVVIDFTGYINGERFQGGEATDYRLELGSQTFLPGFEEQLVGASPGETRSVTVTFPEDYNNAEVAGKEAQFEVTVKELRRTVVPDINDELAQELGFDDLDNLKSTAREQIQNNHDRMSRMQVKRALFDHLDKNVAMDLPPKLVEDEFNAIWEQFEEDRKAGRADPEDLEKDEETLKSEFRQLAERRVKLGLVLSEVGRENNIEVSQQDLQNALMEEARKYPGREQEVVQYYTQSDEGMNSLKAPLFEDKVVDYILERATITDKEVSVDELRETAEEA